MARTASSFFRALWGVKRENRDEDRLYLVDHAAHMGRYVPRDSRCTILVGGSAAARRVYFERLFGHLVCGGGDYFEGRMFQVFGPFAQAFDGQRVVHVTGARVADLHKYRSRLLYAVVSDTMEVSRSLYEKTAVRNVSTLVVSVDGGVRPRDLAAFEASDAFRVVWCDGTRASEPVDGRYWTALLASMEL